MPKVHHIKRAQKDYPDIDVKKGEPYYRWSIKLQRGGLVRMSKTPPKRSQLTVSEFYGTLYSIQEDNEFAKCGSFEELAAMKDDVVGQLEELRDQQQEKLDNMPEGLQQGSTGELLQERYDALDSAISELENVDIPESDEEKPDETKDDEADDLQSVAQQLSDALDSAEV